MEGFFIQECMWCDWDMSAAVRCINADLCVYKRQFFGIYSLNCMIKAYTHMDLVKCTRCTHTYTRMFVQVHVWPVCIPCSDVCISSSRRRHLLALAALNGGIGFFACHSDWMFVESVHMTIKSTDATHLLCVRLFVKRFFFFRDIRILNRIIKYTLSS